MKTNAKFESKIQSLQTLESKLNLEIKDILCKYKNQTFANSEINKMDFFKECVALELSEQSLQLLTTRCSLSFHKDNRSSIEYGIDLVLGWLSEDLIYEFLSANGFKLSSEGSDSKRDFLPKGKITTKADFLYTTKQKASELEIVIAWNSHWSKYDKWDLRESKFKAISRVANKFYCLGIELPTCKGFILDMSLIQNKFVRRNNEAWGGKTVYTLYGVKNLLIEPFEILQKIKELD